MVDQAPAASPHSVRRYSGRSALRHAIVLAVCAWLASPASESFAVGPLELLGLENKQRREAIESIPSDRLTEDAQLKLRDVIGRPSIYRRLPITVIRSDPELYLFLVRHPDVIVNMWDVMGVTKVNIARTSEYAFDAKDGAGTTCNIELMYGDRNVHVMYSEGHYEGNLLRNLIRGRCVLILKSDYAATQDGTVHVTNRLDMFVRFDNVGAELLAKTIHPLVGKSADHNFVESTRFLGQVSDAAMNKQDRLQRFTKKLTKIDDGLRDRFQVVAAGVPQRTTQRKLALAGEGTAPPLTVRASRPSRTALFGNSRDR